MDRSSVDLSPAVPSLQARLRPSQVLDAPGCAGDAVFFPAAYLRHRVRHLRTGTRRNLVWWAKGKARSQRI